MLNEIKFLVDNRVYFFNGFTVFYLSSLLK